MKPASILGLIATALCSACLHSPPNYPGAGGSNIDPARYADFECPDLSGTYEGEGILIEGDADAWRLEKTRGIDYNFPFADDAELRAFMSASRSDDTPYSSQPVDGTVQMAGRRSLRFTVHYENGKSASRIVSFENKTRFVCTGVKGQVTWGGASKGGRSEFGANTSDSMVAIYLDEQGNLISERSMQVHMSMLAGLIPAGTARYHSKYRYKRIR